MALASLLVTHGALEVRAAASSSAGNYVPSDYVGEPIKGTPQVIPGVIQAEAYNVTPGNPKDVTIGGPVVLHQTQFRFDGDSDNARIPTAG